MSATASYRSSIDGTLSGSNRSRSRVASRRSINRSDTSLSGANSTRSVGRDDEALQRQKESEFLVRARSRQTGLQVMRAIVISLQVFSLCVVLAALCYVVFTNFTVLNAIVYGEASFVEVVLLMLGLCIFLQNKSWLRSAFSMMYLAVLILDGIRLWLICGELKERIYEWNCNREKPHDDPSFCPRYLNLPNEMQPFVLRCFLIFMHSVILIFSLVWRACHEGSMDHVKESKRGRKLIRKHSQPPPSSSHHRSKSRRLSNLPPGTVSTFKCESDDFGCQIVKQDGTKQHAVMSSRSSEIFTHSVDGCKKTVVKDTRILVEKDDGKVLAGKLPTQIYQKDINCVHEDFVKIKGQVYPKLKNHGPQKSSVQKDGLTQSTGASTMDPDSTKSAARFNSITMMPALESPIALLNKMEKQRQQNNRSQYAFKK